MKSGFVSLIGRPNVGKSTLLNQIIGTKVAITSDKPQTTRNNITGIYNEEDVQIVFVDTPGIHKPNHQLGKHLNRQAYYSIDDVDIILFLVDVSADLGPGDKFVMERLKDINKPVILVLNKIDKIPKLQILLKIEQYNSLYNFAEIVPVSAVKKDNVDRLISVIKNYLTDEIKYFEDNQITDKRDNFVIAELVREKVFNHTSEEVPHSLTCILETMETSKGVSNIHVSIIIDRESLKKIIIGKNGSKLKQIGIEAREDIEKFLNRKVYLNLFVKVIKNWRDKEKYLKELGFTETE